MYKFYLSLSFAILFTGCQYTTNKDTALDKDHIHLSKIVDTYPRFQNCKEYITTSKEVECFTEQLKTFLNKVLVQRKELILKMDNTEFDLHMSIDRNGQMRIDSLSSIKALNQYHDELQQYLSKRTSSLNLQPALKRGTPVKVKFKMPIDIKYVD